MAYLVNKFGKDDRIYPKDPVKRALVDRMLYFDIGTLYKSMVDYFVSSHYYVYGRFRCINIFGGLKYFVFLKDIALF